MQARTRLSGDAGAGRLGKTLLLATALVLGSVSSARADRSFDLMPLSAAADPYGLLIVDRAQTPDRFEFGMMAQGGWAHNPLRLTLSDPQTGGNPEKPFDVVQEQVHLDVGFYFGLWDFLSVSATLPLSAHFYDDNIIGEPVQYMLPPGTLTPASRGGTTATGLYRSDERQNVPVASAGPRDPRLALKVRFYGGRFFEAGALLEGTLPIGSSASFMGDRSATFRPKLLLGLLLPRVTLALNVGAILREGSSLYDPYVQSTLRYQTGHELSWAAGLTVRAHRLLGLGVEGAGTAPLTGDAVSSTALLLGTVYVQPTEKLKLTVAGGGGVLAERPRNAEARILLGMAFSLSPRAGGLLR